MPLTVITASAGAALELHLPVSCGGDGDGSRGMMGWLNDGCLGCTGEGPDPVEAAAAGGRPCAAALRRISPKRGKQGDSSGRLAACAILLVYQY